MAGKPTTLKVIYAASALRQLDEIWDWNRERYDAVHADAYVEFLQRRISALSLNYRKGKRVGPRPELQYILIRRKPTRHGHIAVYRVDETQIAVLFVFHTAQDWHSQVAPNL